ncbi:MAG TPA: hypothetical protein ENK18_04095 [Deltaproteobacteria bacterium]|nr:hypothetical protein [Deltaproteobacteria bacterium]
MIHLRSAGLGLGLLCLLLCACVPPEPAPELAPLPSPGGHNVLLVLIDDLGLDKVPRYGVYPQQPELPNLDRLADQGVTFRYATAMPVCSPTRATLLTGRLPRRHGLGEAINSSTAIELPLEARLLPEVLRDHSPHPYTSVALGKWHLSTPTSPTGLAHPVEQGFDVYAGGLDNLPSFYSWPKVIEGALEQSETYATTDTTNDAIVQMLTLPEPWFLYVAYHAPHLPFHTPPGDLHGQELGDDALPEDSFVAMAEAMDTELGRLLDALPATLRDRTTVIVSGDNGSEPVVTTPPFDPDRAKVSVYEGGVRVPLIVSSPQVREPGAWSDALVHIADLFPTVAELADVDPGSLGWELDGISLLPWLRDPLAPSGRDIVYTERLVPPGPPPYTTRDDRAVRDATHKLVLRSGATQTDIASLHRFVDDGLDEGPNLLDGPLSADDQEAYDRLLAALRDHEALPYEGW